MSTVGKVLARCRQGVGILKQLARLCQQYAKDEGKANEQRGKKALLSKCFALQMMMLADSKSAKDTLVITEIIL